MGHLLSGLIKYALLPLCWLYLKLYPLPKELVEAVDGKTNSGKQRGKERNSARLNKVRSLNVATSLSHSPASTFSIILSYLSFLFGIVLAAYQYQVDNYNFILIILATAVLLLIPIPIYLKHYVLNLPPEEYSSLIKNTLNESQMLSFISYKIYTACVKFDRSVSDFQPYFIDYDENPKFLSGDGFIDTTDKIKCAELIRRANAVKDKPIQLKKLIDEAGKLEIELQRVSVLIKAFSERIGVPEMEVGDHIFQFNVAMYWIRVKKIISNLEVVSDLVEKLDREDRGKNKHLYDRIRSLLFECFRFADRRNGQFMTYQVQNLCFDDLHYDLIDIATEPSTSEAMKIYVRLLSRSAKEYEQLDSSNIINSKEAIERLSYIYHKRKIHVGLDLHLLSKKILSEMVKTEEPSSSSLKNLSALFESSEFERALRENRTDGNFENSMQALGTLHRLVVSYGEESRRKVGETLCNSKEIQPLLDVPTNGNLFIITFAYSKMVRDILKYSLPKLLINRGLVNDKNINGANPKKRYVQNEKFKIIVLKYDSENETEAKLIKYHLTEEKEKKYTDVTICDYEYILPLITKESNILILLGAEAFTRNKLFIKTSSYNKIYKRFIDAVNLIGPKHIKLFLCVESFKEFKTAGELLEDQYDKIDMYGNMIDTTIVTESEAF